MIAYGIVEFLPASDPQCFRKFECTIPQPLPGDVLVKVRAVAVNPVDTKVRLMQTQPLETPRILGWDASGEVVAVGQEVTRFRVGDAVYYAGDISRPGCNALFQCMDARLVAHKPQRLSYEEAAAMPLTSLTAWEGFERMNLQPGKSILILGGAGGVGSIAIQLAKQMGCDVIATASRPESKQWCLDLGADAVIDHHGDIISQCAALGYPEVDAIANFVNTEAYWQVMGELIAPFGAILLIVEPRELLRLGDPLKAKCVSIHWEFMFARSKFKTPDVARQGAFLEQLSEWIDAGIIRHTATQYLGELSCETLREAHGLLEAGRTIGKIVMSVSGHGDEN